MKKPQLILSETFGKFLIVESVSSSRNTCDLPGICVSHHSLYITPGFKSSLDSKVMEVDKNNASFPIKEIPSPITCPVVINSVNKIEANAYEGFLDFIQKIGVDCDYVSPEFVGFVKGKGHFIIPHFYKNP